MVFRAEGRKSWKARVRHPDGRSKVCGCDTESRATAKQMEQWAKHLYSDRTPNSLAILDAIVSGRTSLPRAFDGRHDLKALVRDMDDMDIEPMVARWQKELERRKKPNAETRAKYLRQVRTLIPAGQPFLRSHFTKTRIREWLESLGIGQTNRHRSAMSSFAQFLALEDVLPGNPVRVVPMQAESEPRTLHLSPLDAKKLIRAIGNAKLQAFHAAMIATGMEHGATKRIDPAKVTESNVFAAGSKRTHRQRTCTIYKRWQWAWDIARAYIEQQPDGSLPFAEVGYAASKWALDKALKATGLNPEYTQHDHRHTWAVQALRDGLEDQVVAHQLGHKDASMVRRVYGKYIPNSGDFARAVVTPEVTPVHVEHEVSDAK